MFIGHAPAGYLLASCVFNRLSVRGVSSGLFLAAGMTGALTPDLDMIYFYLVDHRQHHHHTYFPHFPVVWLALLAASIVWLHRNQASRHAAFALIFCLGGFSHMILDSIVGDIWWFAPFVDRPFSMFTVPTQYQPWWLNFLLHWSFGLELSLWGCAFFAYRKRAPSRNT